MGFSERFKDVISSIEFQLARSFPFFSDGKEIMFFYKVTEVNQNDYTIPEIRYIAVRDMLTNKVAVVKAADILPKEILDSVSNGTNRHLMSVEDELELEDEYLRLYEEVLKDNSCDNEKIQELVKLVYKITEGTMLKQVYLYLGKDFFVEEK